MCCSRILATTWPKCQSSVVRIGSTANRPAMLAGVWAQRAGVAVRVLPADWLALGPSAGPRRNVALAALAGRLGVEYAAGALCIAFPGARLPVWLPLGAGGGA